jgi:hypothetical protein
MTERTTEDDRVGDVWSKPSKPYDLASRLVVVEKFNEWCLVMRFADDVKRGVWPLHVLRSAGYERMPRKEVP